MLGPPSPATAAATIHTSTSGATPASPTRPSRLRGLSYLRSHLHPSPSPSSPSGSTAPHLTRSVSSPGHDGGSASRTTGSTTTTTTTIHSGESGWVPTVQGRSGLSRDSITTSTNTESASASPDPSSNNNTMSRSRAATALGPTATTTATPTSSQPRRQSAMHPFAGTSPLHVTNPSPSTTTTAAAAPSSSSTSPPSSSAPNSKDQLPTIRFIPHLETRSTSARPSLQFTALSRQLTSATTVVRVGRYSERDNASPEPNTLPVGFKSKVVSRRHCELWCTSGQWFIKDVKSSSGTFLNHVRLSAPGQESRPFPVNDGDVVQLGIDFKGGEEVIFRCVKIRIECNRGWQKSLNAYNTTAHKRLLKNAGVRSAANTNRDSDAASVNSSSECSICLNPVAPCQALFVAPCSHVWHYKCVRNLIHGPTWPNFLCPNCRFVADLEADVEPPEVEEEAEDMFEEMGEEEEEEEDEDLLDAGDDDAGRRREQSESSSTDEQRDVLEEEEDDSGASTPRRRGDADRIDDHAPRNGNITDDELAGLLDQTSLHPSQHHRRQQRLSSNDQRGSSSTTAPPNDENTAPSTSAKVPSLSTTNTKSASQPTPSTQPLPISSSSSSAQHPQHTRTSSSDLLNARSATPTSHTQFALASGGSVPDGPMTPRNDVGPFVFDGSGGRGDADADAGAGRGRRREEEGGE